MAVYRSKVPDIENTLIVATEEEVVHDVRRAMMQAVMSSIATTEDGCAL